LISATQVATPYVSVLERFGGTIDLRRSRQWHNLQKHIGRFAEKRRGRVARTASLLKFSLATLEPSYPTSLLINAARVVP